MCKQTVETTSTARVVDADDSVIIWIDGPFETQSFEIPTADVQTFSGFSKNFDCRAVIFRCDRAGGRLRALYPTETGSEVVVHYDLREHDDFNHDGEATVATIRYVEDPMTEEEIEERWTTLWEPTEDDDD